MISKRVAIFGVLALLGASTSAQGLIISGGPSYTLPGGGSCTISGSPSTGTGATVMCTGINLGAHTKVYYGIKKEALADLGTLIGGVTS